MTTYQIHDTLPSGFVYANEQQTDRFIDTGSVNGASKVALVRARHEDRQTEALGEKYRVDGGLDLAVRLRPPRNIEDIQSVAFRTTTDIATYKAQYEAGWKASQRVGRTGGVCQQWDDGSSSHAFDDGYLDQAAGRPKWHLTWCLDHDTCEEGWTAVTSSSPALPSDEALDRAFATAYQQALEASHASANVAIHLGTAAAEALRARCTLPSERKGSVIIMAGHLATMWGFPVVVEEHARPEHVSVRTVKVIL